MVFFLLHHLSFELKMNVGMGDSGSVGKVPALLAWELKFKFPGPTEEAGVAAGLPITPASLGWRKGVIEALWLQG